MAMPVGFTLITLSAINTNIPRTVYWLGWGAGALGIIAFFVALRVAYLENVERKNRRAEDEKRFRSAIHSTEAIKGEIEGLRGDIKRWKMK
jgi:hypothetical protein